MALRLPGLQMARTVGRARRQPPPGIKRSVPAAIARRRCASMGVGVV
ncbi:hypothetical protein H7U18_05655 [Klebsiella pneumoniae]|uniref:Uncharacterized protein n=1 Tax=Klebsiella pneumoniae TaxID=573 RepID=A0A923EPG3_KLEPN|nr:hypothetical protein [Klebsiella pneumoniae]